MKFLKFPIRKFRADLIRSPASFLSSIVFPKNVLFFYINSNILACYSETFPKFFWWVFLQVGSGFYENLYICFLRILFRLRNIFVRKVRHLSFSLRLFQVKSLFSQNLYFKSFNYIVGSFMLITVILISFLTFRL